MLFKRVVKLTVLIGAVLKSYNDLKINFTVQKSMGGTNESADITVSGMGLDDIRYLTTALDYRASKLPLPNYIELEAGYEGESAVIFRGSVRDIVPQFDSELTLVQLSGMAGYAESVSTAVNISIENATLSQVAKNIAKNLGMILLFKMIDAPIGTYSYSGTPLGQMEDFRKYGDFKAYISSGKFIVEYVKMPPVSSVPRINGASGLIGTPSATQNGVRFKTFLRPQLQAGGYIILESAKLPSLDGVYRIMTLKHSGSNRDSEFYTEIEGEPI